MLELYAAARKSWYPDQRRNRNWEGAGESGNMAQLAQSQKADNAAR
jgi:hypothetical protein